MSTWQRLALLGLAVLALEPSTKFVVHPLGERLLVACGRAGRCGPDGTSRRRAGCAVGERRAWRRTRPTSCAAIFLRRVGAAKSPSLVAVAARDAERLRHELHHAAEGLRGRASRWAAGSSRRGRAPAGRRSSRSARAPSSPRRRAQARAAWTRSPRRRGAGPAPVLRRRSGRGRLARSRAAPAATGGGRAARGAAASDACRRPSARRRRAPRGSTTAAHRDDAAAVRTSRSSSGR